MNQLKCCLCVMSDEVVTSCWKLSLSLAGLEKCFGHIFNLYQHTGSMRSIVCLYPRFDRSFCLGCIWGQNYCESQHYSYRDRPKSVRTLAFSTTHVHVLWLSTRLSRLASRALRRHLVHAIGYYSSRCGLEG